MSAIGVSEFLRAAQIQLSQLGEVRSRLNEMRRVHDGQRRDVAARRDTVRSELVASLLPSFTEAGLEGAARLTGFTGLLQKGYIAQAEAERGERLEREAAIKADPRYVDRKLLRDPGVGKLTRAIAELVEFRQPFADVAGKFQHPRLPRLLEAGYGTPRYDVPFWRMSYYADWKAGDEILERFPGKKEFDEALPDYLEAARMLATYDPKLAELRAEVAAGEGLERELAASEEARETLEPRYLGLARLDLAQHLEDLPEEALPDLLAGAPAVAVTVKKWSGLSHQLQYLDAIGKTQIEPARERVERDMSKLQKETMKYSRPKNSGATFEPAAFHQRFDRTRTEKLSHRVDRIGATHERIYRFDRYDHASFASSFLWWDLMTDGKLDGDFIPEVRHFHETHEGLGMPRASHLDEDDLVDASAAVSGVGPDRDAGDAS